MKRLWRQKRGTRSAASLGASGTGKNPGMPARHAVVLLHGWPGSPHDYDAVAARLRGHAELLVPELLSQEGGAPERAERVLAQMAERRFERAIVVGYDVGSRVAQALARKRPQAVERLVLSPPLPGVGDRVLSPQAQAEFWYQPFHQLPLADALIDGSEPAVRAYLGHLWHHWSGPDWTVPADAFEGLVQAYSLPGAFSASISWYRAGAGTVAQAIAERPPEARLDTPTTVLWGSHDPLFPTAWADRLDDHFAATRLHVLDRIGHFVPLEAPQAVADAILT
jgi:pimeloyl-ACP methyl ester carboxylesterase